MVAGVVVAVGALACAARGEASVAPGQLDFGEVHPGATATLDLEVTNTAGSGTLTVDGLAISGPDRTAFRDDFDDAGAVDLAPGGSLTVTVAFTPLREGAHAATLSVQSSGPATLTVPLTGTAVAPTPGDRPLTATPDRLDFGEAPVGGQETGYVTLSNDAGDDISVEAAEVIGPDAGAFAGGFSAQPAGAVHPGGAVTYPVTFAPTVRGTFSAALVVTHSGTNSPLVVPLTGTGVAGDGGMVLYRVNAGGPSLAGSPRWDEDSIAAPSPHANVADSGNSTAAFTPPVDLSDPSVPADTPVEVFTSERYDPGAAPDLAYTFPVPEGVPVEVRLYLAELYGGAMAEGARVFDVRVEGRLVHDDVDVFARVGERAALVLRSPVVSDGAVDVELGPVAGNPAVKGLEVVTTGADVPPVLTATPTAVDFQSVALRQRVRQQVELRNDGTTGPLEVTAARVAGRDAAMYDVHLDVPVTLDPGESVPVDVDFLPAATGTRVATLSLTHTGVGGTLSVPVSGTASPPPTVVGPSFSRSTLEGAGVSAPTSLQFGPDGRLYVAQMDGTIKALTVARSAPGRYEVTATETLTHLRSLPNRDDDGTLAPTVTGRLVTGLLVTGTAEEPTIHAVSSDPRIGAGTSGDDLDLDTNSGVLSRLTRSGAGWQRTDLVRGLPRSEENHASNGLVLDPATNTLLIAQGGNTNMGAPSHNFAFLPEYALSAAVLSVDLDAIGSTTYDLPTLDDEDRPGAVDAADPFGGNDGKNQAVLVPGGPVQVYAAGLRNPYDLVRTAAGRLYTIDNGANAGWGGAPLPDDTTGTCTNDPVETSHTDADSLFHIPGPGFYGGHPNPTRANPANTFNGSNPQSPVAVPNPVECDYRNEVQSGALTTFGFSTNGLVEYPASTFGGSLQGDLLTASHDDGIHRVELDPTGTVVTSRSVLVSSAGALPLDLTAQGDADPFPGTVWVADLVGDAVIVLEPQELACTGADDPGLDEDGDGYDNADEVDNGTNPCSGADVPPDADLDATSDRNDPDDDNDGTSDVADPFAVDPADGRDTALPVVLTWDNDAPPAGGLLGLGFTGLMADLVTDYADRYDPAGMTVGGAAGVVTIDAVGAGDALTSSNTQRDAFQLGIDVDAATGPFVVRTRLPAPFAGAAPAGHESYGLFIGDGTQDDYVRLAVAANGGAGGFALTSEQDGAATIVTTPGPVWPGPGVVDLLLRVDPAAATVQASVVVDGAPPVPVGGPVSVPAAWFGGGAGPAVGIIATAPGTAPPFPATWDFLEVRPAT